MPKTDLVPIKVKIEHGELKGHKFPEFNNLPVQARKFMDWSHYIDAYGTGWHYSEEGFDEGRAPEYWYACTCVPEDFAVAAADKFSGQVTIITETEFEEFYDNEAMVNQDTEFLDTNALQGLTARIQLEESSAPTVEPSEDILELRRKMLDPDDPKQGIRKNPKKKWKDCKKHSNFGIHKKYRKPFARGEGTPSL